MKHKKMKQNNGIMTDKENKKALIYPARNNTETCI